MASPVLQPVHCRPPDRQTCEIIKGGLFDGQPEWICGQLGDFRSLLDGWVMCEECAESMPYLWPERMN